MTIPGEGSGKGDTPRKVNKKEFDKSYERIFKKKSWSWLNKVKLEEKEKKKDE